jgi:hypothetical protein
MSRTPVNPPAGEDGMRAFAECQIDCLWGSDPDLLLKELGEDSLGLHVCRSNGNVYTGMFVADNKEGAGRFSWSNGDIYEGEWVKDEMHGQGTRVKYQCREGLSSYKRT